MFLSLSLSRIDSLCIHRLCILLFQDQQTVQQNLKGERKLHSSGLWVVLWAYILQGKPYFIIYAYT